MLKFNGCDGAVRRGVQSEQVKQVGPLPFSLLVISCGGVSVD